MKMECRNGFSVANASRSEGKLASTKQSVKAKRFLRCPQLVGVLLLAGGLFLWTAFYSLTIIAAPAIESPSFQQPETLKELLALSPTELEHCDIARMNLLCAKGLPGAEKLNADESLAALDLWAQHIQSEIDRNFHDDWMTRLIFITRRIFTKWQ